MKIIFLIIMGTLICLVAYIILMNLQMKIRYLAKHGYEYTLLVNVMARLHMNTDYVNRREYVYFNEEKGTVVEMRIVEQETLLSLIDYVNRIENAKKR